MKSLTALLFTLLCTGVFAQSTLSLKEAVQIAIDNNIRLKQEQNNLLGNEASRQAAMLSMGPTVSANASGGSQTGNSFNQQEGVVVNGTVDFVSGSIGADMDLFRGFRNLNGLRQSNVQLDAQKHTVRRTEQEIISQTSAQFLQALLSQELLKIAQENLDFQNKNLEMIHNEVSLGAKAKVDEYNQISLVKNAELLVFRAKVNLRNEKANLALILLTDPGDDFMLVEPDYSLLAAPDLATSDLDGLMNGRSDITSSRLLQESNKFQMSMTKSNYLPSLSLFANYGSRYNRVQGFASRSFDQQFFTDNTYFNYGLALNVPIFNGMRNKSQYIQDKIRYENSVLTRQSLEMEVKNDIQRAILNFNDAKVNYDLAQASLEAAEAAYNLNNESYELGLASLIDLSQSNRDYFQARSDLASAKLTLMFQDILLKDAVGTLTVEDIK